MLDTQGQPLNTNFNKSRNVTKSLMSLKGILKGVAADHSLNEMELLFLNTWLRSHKELPLEGDVLDLTTDIEEVIQSKSISKEQLDDIELIIEDIIDFSELVPKCVEDLTNELLGFISGISADNEVTREEFLRLLEWLQQNEDAMTCWPGNVIARKIVNILEDKIIEPEELEDFTQVCKMISGQQFLETGTADGISNDFCTQPLDYLPQTTETICFTGKFLLGTRNKLHIQAEELGIRPLKDVTQYLDILVVGGLASNDWRFTSHGRKIEQTINNQNKGAQTLIISEDNWANILNDSKTKPLRDIPVPSNKNINNTICFTGFSANDKKALINAANELGLVVVKSVTADLKFLVYGANAGPQKLAKAKNQKVICFTDEEFVNFMETGELPELH